MKSLIDEDPTDAQAYVMLAWNHWQLANVYMRVAAREAASAERVRNLQQAQVSYREA